MPQSFCPPNLLPVFRRLFVPYQFPLQFFRPPQVPAFSGFTCFFFFFFVSADIWPQPITSSFPAFSGSYFEKPKPVPPKFLFFPALLFFFRQCLPGILECLCGLCFFVPTVWATRISSPFSQPPLHRRGALRKTFFSPDCPFIAGSLPQFLSILPKPFPPRIGILRSFALSSRFPVPLFHTQTPFPLVYGSAPS